MKKLITLAVSLCLILSTASICSFADENEEQEQEQVYISSSEVSIDNDETASCQYFDPADLEEPDPRKENLSTSQTK